MVQRRSAFEQVAAGLAEDPAFAAFARPDAALLIWDREGERLLWASPAAVDLAAVLSDEAGPAAGASPVRARLRALGHGLAPPKGVRLERIRFDPNRLVPPVTCACRLASLETGEEVLVLALLGPLPKPSARPAAPSTAPAIPPPIGAAAPTGPRESVQEAVPLPAETPPAREHGPVRFLWRADRAGRFTEVSDALAGAVGPGSAAIVGRTFEELAKTVICDRAGAVAGLFSRREAWSGREVLWRLDGTDEAVPVELAGMPILDRHRRLAGFRGFGVIRMGARVAWPQAEAAAAAGAGRVPDVDHAVDGSDAVLPPDPGALAPEPTAAPPALPPAPAGFEPSPDPELSPEGTASALGRAATAPESAPPQPVPAHAGSGPAPEFDLPAEEDRPASVDATEADGAAAEFGADEAAPGQAAAADFRPSRERRPATPDPEPAPTPTPPTRPAPEGAGEADRRAAASASRLSGAERTAFREIARALGARFAGDEPTEPAPQNSAPAEVARLRPPPPPDPEGARILDRLPIGILVHRGEEPLFANRYLLDLVGHDSLDSLVEEGGLAPLFQGRAGALGRFEESAAPFALATRERESVAVEIRLASVEWGGFRAGAMLIRRVPETDSADRVRALELDLRHAEARLREVATILDTATDGVIVVDDLGRILSMNRSAEALFGYDQKEVAGDTLTILLAPESRAVAAEYMEGLRANGVASILNDGREVLGRVRQGGTIPLSMTIGRINDGPERRFCAVLRDITAFKKAEGELVSAKRAAEEANLHKSDLLAKISHEVRTPLNAIIGFAEVMLEERFGPVGNERYKDYLRDIHASGGHVIGLLNDFVDLARIEAGRMELAFTSVEINRVVSSCVALLQPQAARNRIVMRVGLTGKLPPVVADERSIRQITLNIVSNAIKFTEAGGQVIVSTALTDRGEVAIRVRDTGIGMTGEEVEAALEPFRQLATARKADGTGLGLPLTKALVEANRGALAIASTPNEGTLVEVLFPPTRVLAQ